ncbi:hypothetical protein HID58_013419, partial [Brassica napus]
DRATTAKRSSYDGDGEEIKRRRRRDRATTVTKSSDDDDEIECIPRSRRDRVMTVKSSKNHKLVLTQGEDLWFTFSDQPMRFSLREFHLITGLRCEENQTITEPQFKIMKKPYIWMLGKIDKFTVRMLYEMFKEKTRSMPKLERLSLGTAIITEAVIMAENPSSKIPRDRLQCYMNYRSPKIAWVNVLGKSLGKPCETSSSSDPLCLHWDSTRTPTTTEVLELENINNVKEQRKDKNHSMSNSEKLDKLIQKVQVSIQEDRFKGSWYRAILEQNPTRVKGKKLRVSYKTMCNEDGVNPLKETIERSFIRPVPPECLNEGAVFKEGSVVDAYFNNGWWTGVIVVERPDGSFLVYFDDQPDIMRFIRNQLRPHADWIGSKWVKSKNKVLFSLVLSQHMFRRAKLVEMTREISESEKEKIWSAHWSSPHRDLCAEYSLNDCVEVVVTHGWRKGRVTEILLENKYKVDFAATKEDAVLSQHMFRRAKLVEMTREISESEKEKIWSEHWPSPPRDLCAEYSLNDYVEVVVTHGWRKGRVTEILLENKY